MRREWTVLAGLALATTHCSVESTVPSTASIVCENDSQCPKDFECNEAVNRCRSALFNSPPLVSLDVLPASPRWLQGVQFEAIVSDAEGDLVDLELSFQVGENPPCPATTSTPLTGLSSSPAGERAVYRWTALADAQANLGCGLEVANALVPADSAAGEAGPCTAPGLTLPTLGDGDDDLVVGCVLVLEDLQLFATPTDQGTNARSGAETSDRDVVGEIPPAVAPMLEQIVYRGFVPVEFLVLDSVTADGVGTDTVDVEIQFSIDGGVTWYAPDVDGPTTNLPSVARNAADAPNEFTADPAADATPYILVWDTRDALPAPIGSEGETVGGVGSTIQRDVVVRMRGSTLFDNNPEDDAPPRVFGEWVQSQPFRVDNQTPPTVEDIQVLNRGAELYSGALHFTYRLVDTQSDLVDVRFEYSLDEGATFQPATEWPWILSEGFYDLEARPIDPASGGGLPHRFSWDIAADVSFSRDDVVIRVQAADDFDVGPPAFVILESEVGPVPVLGVDTDSCFTSYNFATSDLTVELIDADGVNGSDLLVFDRENPGLFSPRGATPTRDSPFDGEFPLPPEAQGRSIGVGPLFGSRDDLVSRVDESRLNVLSYDDSLGNYVALNPAIGATSSRGLAPRIGDFDGDGDNDIVEAADSALLVHLNPGDGTSAFETRTVDLGAIVVAYAVGELAGGAPGADIAVLVREAADPDDELATASLFIVSNLTVPSMPVAGGIEFVLTSGGPLDDQHQNILLEVEDANRDGTDDIFVVRAVSEDEATAVFFTRPDTEWREVAFFEDAIEARPERVRFLDVNADGDTDILLFLNDNSVAVYLGLSGAELNFIQSDDVALNGRDVAVLVGENTTDFVIASIEGASDRTVRICITPEIPPPPSDLYREDSTDEELQGDPSLLLVTDLTRDGIADALVAEEEIYRAFAGERSRSVGLGDLTLAAVPEPLGDGSGVSTVAGDFNGDGILDLVTYDASEPEPESFFLRGTRTDGNQGFADPEEADGLMSAPALAADFDGDGFDELVSVDASVITVFSAAASLAEGGFGERQSLTASATIRRLHAADLNGDGRMDLAVVESQGVAVYFGQGTGTPLSASSTAVGTATSTGASVAGDIDNDGRGEFAVVIDGELQLFGLSGTSLRASSVTRSLVLPAGLQELVAVDLSGDGVLDILGRGSTELWLLSSNVVDEEARPFLSLVNLGALAPPVLLGVGDIHLDGVPDLFVAGDELTVGVGQRVSSRSGWTRFLAGEDILGAAVNQGADRFGEARRFPLSVRRTVGAEDDVGSANDLRSDFSFRLKSSGLAGLGDPSALVAVTSAYEFRGDRRVRPVAVDDGVRLQVVPRYGELSAATGDLITVALPLALDVIDPTAVRVFLLERQWLSAADVTDPALAGNPDLESFLAFNDGTVVRERGVWRELPSTGSNGFTVEDERILVPLDRFGILRAYETR